MVFLSSKECGCASRKHVPHLIAITGGPGAGKTTILELAKRHFCRHVGILRESASILYSGGYPRIGTINGRKAAQKAIFHVQRSQEEMVLAEPDFAAVICDRGTLDGWAYWPNHTKNFFDTLGIQRPDELNRYKKVIHLQTPSLKNGYDLSNPNRIEGPNQAKKLDTKTWNAWKGHPNHVLIPSEADFLEKAKRTIQELEQAIPPCCTHFLHLP